MRNKPTLTLAVAHKVMAACKAEAEKNKWQVAIAILDDGGYLLHFDRMDGVGKIPAEVASGKARTAGRSGPADHARERHDRRLRRAVARGRAGSAGRHHRAEVSRDGERVRTAGQRR